MRGILPAEHGSSPGPGGLPPPAAGRCRSGAALPGGGHPGPGSARSPEGFGGYANPQTLQPPLGMSRVGTMQQPPPWTEFSHTGMCVWEK